MRSSGKKDPYTDSTSSLSGWWGKIETVVKQVRYLSQFIFFLVVMGICLVVMGTAASIGFVFYEYVSPDSPWMKGLTLLTAYVVYGLSLLVLSPATNFLLQLNRFVKPWRGGTHSLRAIPWFLHNALIYIVRYSFLEFVTPSPLNIFFYRMMGMKIGKGVVINSTNLSDVCLIELGDYVTIGGSAHLLCHYSQGGYLVLSTIKIGARSTIGLKASIFGNVVIGEGCTVRPHQVVLPKTKLSDGEKL